MPEKPEKYFTAGPAPRSKRGKRRHAAREGTAKEHAAAVHTDRGEYISSIAHRPTFHVHARLY